MSTIRETFHSSDTENQPAKRQPNSSLAAWGFSVCCRTSLGSGMVSDFGRRTHVCWSFAARLPSSWRSSSEAASPGVNGAFPKAQPEANAGWRLECVWETLLHSALAGSLLGPPLRRRSKQASKQANDAGRQIQEGWLGRCPRPLSGKFRLQGAAPFRLLPERESPSCADGAPWNHASLPEFGPEARSGLNRATSKPESRPFQTCKRSGGAQV